MLEELKQFAAHISNSKITEDSIIKTADLEKYETKNIFIVDDPLWKKSYCLPTFEINDQFIRLTMDREQALFYLNENCVNALQSFNDLLYKYINVYNKLQVKDNNKVPSIFQYIGVFYNLETKQYDVSITYNTGVFLSLNDASFSQRAFLNTLRNLRRVDVESLMTGEMRTLGTVIMINSMKGVNSYLTNCPEDNKNLIYSSDNKPLTHIFVTENNLFKTNEMFEAIQSFLDTTENDDCNILDPNLIKNEKHIKDLVDVIKMIKV